MTYTPDGNGYFQRSDATVLIAEPEVLVVKAVIGGMSTLFIVAHAPHRGHRQQDIVQWWQKLSDLLHGQSQGIRTILLCDANAGVDEHWPYIGDVFPQTIDTGGKELLRLLRTFDLCIPSTFADTHRGPSETWHSAKVTTGGNRNDYVILSRDLRRQCLESYVDASLDAGNQAIDHTAATVIIDWMPTTHRGQGPHHTWDRDKIRLADEATWEAFFSDWPSVPWDTDLTTHMAQIEDHLHQKLHDFDFMTQKNRLKKVLCNSKRQCERHQLHAALLSWRRRCMLNTSLANLLCVLRTTWRWIRYKALGLRIKQKILTARADWLQRQV